MPLPLFSVERHTNFHIEKEDRRRPEAHVHKRSTCSDGPIPISAMMPGPYVHIHVYLRTYIHICVAHQVTVRVCRKFSITGRKGRVGLLRTRGRTLGAARNTVGNTCNRGSWSCSRGVRHGLGCFVARVHHKIGSHYCSRAVVH